MKLLVYTLILLSFVFVADARAQSLDDNQKYHNFISQVRRIKRAFEEKDKIFPMEFYYCVKAYDELIASGVAPSTRVLPDDSLNVSGTVEEAKQKFCVDPEKKVDADWDAKQAPYKAVLKGDKLRLMINQNSRVIYRYATAGGKYTDDPRVLAAASVWFLDVGAPSNEARYCLNGGKRSSVRRYAFDAQHKLLGTTEKAYCGTPPASAYR